MSLQRYTEYRESGDTALGRVPAHWELCPVKAIAAIDNSGCYGTDPDDADNQLPVATTAQIDPHGRFDVAAMPVRGFSDDEIRRFACRAGDILVVKSSGSATNIISGKSGIVSDSTERFVFSNFLLRLVPRVEKVLPSYLYRFIASPVTRERVQLMCSSTTYPNLRVGEYVGATIPLPPMPEQSAIAAFLDRETAKIDALIAEQEKLIAMLAEKRQATISHAVTKGINPDAPMRDSGVPWLGEVPAHWGITRLGAILREVSEPGNDNLPVLSVSIHDGVSDKELDDAEMDRKVTRSDDRSKYKSVSPGDLTYNMMRAWQGGFGAVTVVGMVSPAYVVARPIVELLTSHLEALLRSPNAVIEMKRRSQGVTDFRLRLYWQEFKTMHVALPPLIEQQAIGDYLASETGRFDALINEAKKATTLLKERRSALIAAAVTGQIDVRGLVSSQEAA